MDRSENPLCFRSTLFKVEPGEEEEVNPNCFGRQLAHWLRDKFSGQGYTDAEVIPEDWGWCVMLRRDPFMLWIGCGNIDLEHECEYNPYSQPECITWRCFVTGEVPFWNRLFRKVDPQAVKDVKTKLGALLQQEPQITMVDEAEL